VADQVVNGFKGVGFIYLEGHRIPSSTLDGLFRKVCILVMGYNLVETALKSEC
jgi:hypothetical protein